MTADGDGEAGGESESDGPAGEDGADEGTPQDATVSPDFEEEFPSVTVGSESPGSPSSEEAGSADDADAPAGRPSSPAEAAEEASGDGLGWQGWVLVGALIVAMGVIPWAIVFLPAIQGTLGSLGLGLRDAYLVLPMIPALGLGVLAVWAALAYRRREN